MDNRVVTLKDIRKYNRRRSDFRCWYAWATMELGYGHLKALMYAYRLRNEPMFDVY